MSSSTVGITTSMVSNLEKEVQRRMEADERQMDPINRTVGESRWEVSIMCTDSQPAEHPQNNCYAGCRFCLN